MSGGGYRFFLKHVLAAAIVSMVIASIWLSVSVIESSSHTPPARRVVVFSIDSAEPETVMRLAIQGKLPGFSRILLNGVFSEGMVVAFPSATAVTHAVLSTGAPPHINGVTGNRIHLPGSRIYQTVNGFNGRYLEAEPLWVALDRQNLSSVVAAFPHSTPAAWENVSRAKLFNPYDSFIFPISFSTLYTSNESVSRAYVISFREATNWSNLDLIGSVRDAVEASFKFGDDTWWILVFDSDGDGVRDRVILTVGEKDLLRAVALLSEGEWSPPINVSVRFKGNIYTVAPRFKAIEVDNLEDFRLYRSIARPLEGMWFNDRELAQAVWRDVVLNVGMITGADWFGLVNGWYGEDVFMETAELANEFFRSLTEYLLRNTEWNLLMTYTPVVDSVLHQFLGLTDPSMPYYREDLAERYERYIEEAYMLADRFLQTILDNVDLSDTAVIVVSDHGQWSVGKLVYINSILYNAGLLKVDERGRVIANETMAYYIGYNQIFINLKDREDGGIVDQAEYEALVNKIVDLLKTIVDPDTGEPVFSYVAPRDKAIEYGLSGERAGDIVFSLKPGYAAWTGINIRDGKGVVFVDAVPLKTVTGWHSDLPTYRDLYGIFGAVGAGIERAGVIGVVNALGVAPTIAALLGVDPPKDAVGAVLPILSRPVQPAPASTVTVTLTQIVTAVQRVVETVTSTLTMEVVETVTEVETVERTVTVERTLATTVTVESVEAEAPPSMPQLGADALLIAVAAIVFAAGFALGYIVVRRRYAF